MNNPYLSRADEFPQPGCASAECRMKDASYKKTVTAAIPGNNFPKQKSLGAVLVCAEVFIKPFSWSSPGWKRPRAHKCPGCAPRVLHFHVSAGSGAVNPDRIRIAVEVCYFRSICVGYARQGSGHDSLLSDSRTFTLETSVTQQAGPKETPMQPAPGMETQRTGHGHTHDCHAAIPGPIRSQEPGNSS
jgi:hypothetical protein